MSETKFVNRTKLNDEEAKEKVKELLADPEVINNIKPMLLQMCSKWAIENDKGQEIADLSTGIKGVIIEYVSGLPIRPDAKSLLLSLEYLVDTYVASFTQTQADSIEITEEVKAVGGAV